MSGHTTTASEELVICSSIILVATSLQLVVDRIALVFILVNSLSIIKQKFYTCNKKFKSFLFLVYILGSLFCNCNLALIRLYFHV